MAERNDPLAGVGMVKGMSVLIPFLSLKSAFSRGVAQIF